LYANAIGKLKCSELIVCTAGHLVILSVTGLVRIDPKTQDAEVLLAGDCQGHHFATESEVAVVIRNTVHIFNIPTGKLLLSHEFSVTIYNISISQELIVSLSMWTRTSTEIAVYRRVASQRSDKTHQMLVKMAAIGAQGYINGGPTLQQTFLSDLTFRLFSSFLDPY